MLTCSWYAVSSFPGSTVPKCVSKLYCDCRVKLFVRATAHKRVYNILTNRIRALKRTVQLRNDSPGSPHARAKNRMGEPDKVCHVRNVLGRGNLITVSQSVSQSVSQILMSPKKKCSWSKVGPLRLAS